MAKTIYVVAAIVLRGGQVFLTKRADDAHQGGKWEFPGGKVEPGESAIGALSRELKEEIGITIADMAGRETNIETGEAEIMQSQAFMTVEHDYPEKKVILDFFLISEFAGEPGGCEGQSFAWFGIDELAQLDFPDANQVVVEKLMLASPGEIHAIGLKPGGLAV